jgi:hypothetical protein
MADANAPRKRCSGNLRPAPFGFTPRLVAQLLDAAASPAPFSPRPSAEIPPRAADGQSEPARVAPALVELSAPAGNPSPGRADLSDGLRDEGFGRLHLWKMRGGSRALLAAIERERAR